MNEALFGTPERGVVTLIAAFVLLGVIGGYVTDLLIRRMEEARMAGWYDIRHETGPQGHRYVITYQGREHATGWHGGIGAAREAKTWLLEDLGIHK